MSTQSSAFYTPCDGKWVSAFGLSNNNKLCAWRHNMPPPPCTLTISSHLFARWHLFRHVGYLGHRQQVDLWPFDLESGVRVTCDVSYLCANFSLPRPSSRVRPDIRDRHQTKASLNASALWGRRHNKWRWWLLSIAAYRRTHSPSQAAWSDGRRPLGAVLLHSSNEPSELSLWPCGHDDSTINIVLVIITCAP